ncbi:hypothetical protein LXL04_005945 [Taraxacum kok-saghyz]
MELFDVGKTQLQGYQISTPPSYPNSDFEIGETSNSVPINARSRRRAYSQLFRNANISTISTRPSRRRLTYGDSQASSSTNLMPSYSDSGDPTFVCRKCLAFFWYGERVLCSSCIDNLTYNQCCKSGDVHLPAPREPPAELNALLDMSTFMDNIRAYNTMFSMTSFGAKID